VPEHGPEERCAPPLLSLMQWVWEKNGKVWTYSF